MIPTGEQIKVCYHIVDLPVRSVPPLSPLLSLRVQTQQVFGGRMVTPATHAELPSQPDHCRPFLFLFTKNHPAAGFKMLWQLLTWFTVYKATLTLSTRVRTVTWKWGTLSKRASMQFIYTITKQWLNMQDETGFTSDSLSSLKGISQSDLVYRYINDNLNKHVLHQKALQNEWKWVLPSPKAEQVFLVDEAASHRIPREGRDPFALVAVI